MNLGDSIRDGSKWLLFGSLSGRVMQFLFGIVLARLIAPEQFGFLVTISVFTGVANFFANGGMGQALIRSKQASKRDYNVVFTIQLLICCCIFLSLYLLAPSMANFFNNDIYIDLLRVSALSFLMRPFFNLPSVILQRAMKFKTIAWVNLSTMVISSILTIILAWYDFKVWSLVFGGLCNSVLKIIFLLYVTRWLPAFAWHRETIKQLGGYGLKLSINDILEYLKPQLTNLMISKLISPAALGIFNKADSLAYMPKKVVAGSIYQVLFRALAKTQDDADTSRYMLFRSITLLTVYLSPAYILLWWLAEPFITLVYGQTWYDVAAPLQIMALIGLFMFDTACGAVIAAQDRLGKEIQINLECIALLCIGYFYFYPQGLVYLACVSVAVKGYSNVRLYMLTKSILACSWTSLLQALLPAYGLGVALILMLNGLDRLLPTWLISSPVLYMLTISGFAGAVYFIMFLYLPIASLKAESQRWKTKISHYCNRSAPSSPPTV